MVNQRVPFSASFSSICASICKVTGAAIALSVLGGFWSVTSPQALAQRNSALDPQQVPTARYARGEDVDLSLIVEEWRARYPETPVFACTCTTETCGNAEQWPFRTFTLYQPFVALGNFNAANYQSSGFNCFDMESGDRPEA